jgi:5-(carboxyamino)imidazole ribonucleotide synthase
VVFPSVDVAVDARHARHFLRAALPLGITLHVQPVTDPAPPAHGEWSVLVARSPHGQASCWSPARMRPDGITLLPGADEESALLLQARALAAVAAAPPGVSVAVFDADAILTDFLHGAHPSWLWTVGTCVTDAYEQHLRAVLDLPLGDTTRFASVLATAPILVGEKTDMYHPYLHLFARDPAIKVHLDPEVVAVGAEIGHLAVSGDDIETVLDGARHAADYFAGVIDE